MAVLASFDEVSECISVEFNNPTATTLGTGRDGILWQLSCELLNLADCELLCTLSS
jgi:hypothetical protein